jgi:hypothetical protein
MGMVVLKLVVAAVIKNASHYHWRRGRHSVIPFQKAHFFCEKSQGPVKAPETCAIHAGRRRVREGGEGRWGRIRLRSAQGAIVDLY